MHGIGVAHSEVGNFYLFKCWDNSHFHLKSKLPMNLKFLNAICWRVFKLVRMVTVWRFLICLLMVLSCSATCT